MQPQADQTWFNFFSDSGIPFDVYSFQGTEGLSQPYEFNIELVAKNSAVDINSMLGQAAALTILDRSGEKRVVRGNIRSMKQLHTVNFRTHYQCRLVPRFWFLSLTSNHRIFQEKTVPDIIKMILEEQGFDGKSYKLKLSGSFEPREYCVQYGESDFHFISRLCEEEGIFYMFEHTDDAVIMEFKNMPGGPRIVGESDLRFYPGSGALSDTSVISRFNLQATVNSNEVTFRDWNFEKPSLDLTVNKKETSKKKAAPMPGVSMETYTYPHIYQLKKMGEQYTNTQLLRQITYATTVEGNADVSRLTPGCTFKLKEHPRKDLNAIWMLTEVMHYGEQPQVLEQEAPDRGMHYSSSFIAIPETTRFVPPVLHPKQRVAGQQTALVTGPKGEEIYPDKYGRVKVQFFWDREGEWDEKTTCWIRVSQGWAGTNYGTMAIPRIGHEVIVSFMEGDLDRPIITGRVYHAQSMPPYALPANKTRTVFKSMSTPGGENEERGFNELRIEDKKGAEEIYVHAEKDINTYTKNDWKDHVLHDRHITIDHFSFLHTEGETHETLKEQRKTELFANDNITIHASRHEKIDEKWLTHVGEEVHIKAGTKIVIEAGAEMTLKAGGSFVKIDGSGVYAVGPKVKLNSGGSPASGTKASPKRPNESKTVDRSPAPKKQALALKNAAKKGSKTCPVC